MTAVQFRNPEVRLSEALETTRAAVSGHEVTLRELAGPRRRAGSARVLRDPGMPFMLPVTLPFMSTALGLPMLLIGFAVVMNRLPWLPDRILDRALPSITVQHVLERASRAASRFEHLVRPRLLGLSASATINRCNGSVLVVAVLLLMAPCARAPGQHDPRRRNHPALPRLAERDGVLIILGYVVTLLSVLYIGAIVWALANVGSDPQAATNWSCR